MKNGLITFVFDDGNATDYTMMKPLFDRLKEVACIAVVSEDIKKGGALSIEQLKELENDGWEILSHSRTHPLLTNLSEEDIEKELGESKKDLIEMGLNINNLVYPSHDHNNIIKEIAAKYYNSARGGKQGINPEKFDRYSLASRIINYETGIEESKSFVDQAEADKKWMIFYLHALDIKNAVHNPEQFMEELIEYIKDKRIKIVTMNRALEIIK